MLLPIVENVAFRVLPENPGYCVGDDGSVWSRLRMGRKQSHGRPISPFAGSWQRMKLIPGKTGYLVTTLSYGAGVQKSWRVHVLVLLAFVGPAPEGTECRHLNGIRTDNRLENLAWGTRAENVADMMRHGTCARSRLTWEEVWEIRRRFVSGETVTSLMREFRVVRTNIHNIVKGKTWKEPGVASQVFRLPGPGGRSVK
jgi:hypothetical protein